jgi:hypothetical protein
MKRSRKISGPFLLSMNPTDHIIMARLTIIEAMPVIKKLGIIVNAGSLPYTHILFASPMALIIRPFMGVFP